MSVDRGSGVAEGEIGGGGVVVGVDSLAHEGAMVVETMAHEVNVD